MFSSSLKKNRGFSYKGQNPQQQRNYQQSFQQQGSYQSSGNYSGSNFKHQIAGSGDPNYYNNNNRGGGNSRVQGGWSQSG